MSILDALPHSFTAKKRTRVKDILGGNKDSFATVSSGSCWFQQAGDSETTEFMKRGINLTGKVYFATNPSLDESHVLVVNDKDGVEVGMFDIVSTPDIDASAGLGVLWRCNVNRKTSEP